MKTLRRDDTELAVVWLATHATGEVRDAAQELLEHLDIDEACEEFARLAGEECDLPHRRRCRAKERRRRWSLQEIYGDDIDELEPDELEALAEHLDDEW